MLCVGGALAWEGRGYSGRDHSRWTEVRVQAGMRECRAGVEHGVSPRTSERGGRMTF